MGQMMGDKAAREEHRGQLLCIADRDLEWMLMVMVLWYFRMLLR